MGDARCEDRPRQSKFMWGGDWLMATAASISRARSFRCIFFFDIWTRACFRWAGCGPIICCVNLEYIYHLALTDHRTESIRRRYDRKQSLFNSSGLLWVKYVKGSRKWSGNTNIQATESYLSLRVHVWKRKGAIFYLRAPLQICPKRILSICETQRSNGGWYQNLPRVCKPCSVSSGRANDYKSNTCSFINRRRGIPLLRSKLNIMSNGRLC